MYRIVPALVAASLAASGAALAQNTNIPASNGSAPVSGPGATALGTAPAMNTAPVVGGAGAGIAPMGTPPTVGATSMENGVAPGATPMMNSNQRQINGDTMANNPGAMNQAPVPGANSFTAGQARARFQHDGFTQVNGLHKDRQGIWRGKAMKDGQSVNVALDYQGKVFGQ